MEKTPEQDSGSTPLAEYLKSLRAARGFTLRDVEEGTEISNAYLSQLENRRVTKPSPHILHSLADFYGVGYEVLMEKAGYIKKQSASDTPKTGKPKTGRLPASALGKVTGEEEEELLRYLAFIRSQKRRK